MRIISWIAAAAATTVLAGCYTYPVYQPAPYARLTPAQSAAIAQQQPLNQADRVRLAQDNAQVQREDAYGQSQAAAAQPYPYAYPVAPYYDYGYYGYPYPYYGGFYPFFPGVSLSLGFRGGFRGGFHGGGGFHHR
jgi:hypothetical protein